MKTWPAIDACGIDSDRLLAELDEFSPAALEEQAGAIRVFFASPALRDEALAHLAVRGISAAAVDVPDEDWARRSQENLTPIVVGRLCVTPPWHADRVGAPGSGLRSIVIHPSMGFGTGHHATTRLCLEALQETGLAGKHVIDVGTGSGVLAIAAAVLGAKSAVGIDNDPDAIRNARENLAFNPAVTNVRFELADLAAGIAPAAADVVTANLTGALLCRAADRLLTAALPGGTLILSGLMQVERAEVEAAFSRARLVRSLAEDEWAACIFERPTGPTGGPNGP